MFEILLIYMLFFSLFPLFLSTLFIFSDKYEEQPEIGKTFLFMLSIIPLLVFGAFYYVVNAGI